MKDKASGFEVRENKKLKYSFGEKLIEYMSVVMKGSQFPVSCYCQGISEFNVRRK